MRFAIACLATVSIGAQTADQLSYDGSSTVYPLIVAFGESYADIDPRFSITAKPSGSTAGFRSLIGRNSTISGASRPINAKELQAAKDAGITFVEVPIAYDALTVVAHPRNTWLKDLSVPELQRLFGAGGPTSWKQVREGFPDLPVKVFGPGSDSGTYDYFQEAVLGKERKFRTDYASSEDDHILVQNVAADKNAVAFFGIAYVIENAQLVRPVAVAPATGASPVMPSMQTVVDGSYTPLSRPIFVYIRSEDAGRPDLAGFLNHILDRPETVESVGYIPLPSEMRRVVKQRLAERRTGSLFSGAAPGTSLTKAVQLENQQPVPPPTPQAAAPAAPTKPSTSAWQGPEALRYHQDLDRLRHASVNLARLTVDDRATLEELSERGADLKRQIDAMLETFRSAPRGEDNRLSLGEAQALVR